MKTKLWIPRLLIMIQAVQFTLPLSNGSAMGLEYQTFIYDSYAAEKSGDLNKAVEKMVAALESNPNDYYINLRLGFLFLSEKKYKNSIEHYERASKTAPRSIEPLLGLSLVYYSTGSFDNTVKACSQILQIDSKNYLGLQRLITSYIRLRDIPKALEKTNEAIQIYPTDPVFLEQYAVVLKESGKNEEAQSTLNTLLLVNPQNEYARAALIAK